MTGDNTRTEAWRNKVDFAARRLAESDGKLWSDVPEKSRWRFRRSRSDYRKLASLAIGSGNLWDMFREHERT